MHNIYKKVGEFSFQRSYFAFVNGNAMISYVVQVYNLSIRYDRYVRPNS